MTLVYTTFVRLYNFCLQLKVVFKKWNVTYDCMQKVECVAKMSQTPSVEIRTPPVEIWVDPTSGNMVSDS